MRSELFSIYSIHKEVILSIQQLLENRVSTVQTKMTGGRVSDEHIHQALKATTAIPIHGKKNPLHFVVFNYENREKALDLLYKTKAKKIEREPFNELCGGIGTVILGFIKKNISEKIPDYESEYSGSTAMYAMQLSFFNNNYCIKWNSIFDEDSKTDSIFEDLGLSKKEYKSLGMLLVGTGSPESRERPDYNQYTKFI